MAGSTGGDRYRRRHVTAHGRKVPVRTGRTTLAGLPRPTRFWRWNQEVAAMAETDAGRVVVGISADVAGYQALRYAVTAARDRQAPLLVVRVYNGRSPGSAQWGATLAEAAMDDVHAAFQATFGGPPRDLSVQMLCREGVTGAALTAAADRTSDLLVIGGSGTHRLSRLWSGAVARYCARHAVCPVVIVPPPALARSGRTSRLAKATASGAEEFLRTSAGATVKPTPPPQAKQRTVRRKHHVQ